MSGTLGSAQRYARENSHRGPECGERHFKDESPVAWSTIRWVVDYLTTGAAQQWSQGRLRVRACSTGLGTRGGPRDGPVCYGALPRPPSSYRALQDAPRAGCDKDAYQSFL